MNLADKLLNCANNFAVGLAIIEQLLQSNFSLKHLILKKSQTKKSRIMKIVTPILYSMKLSTSKKVIIKR